MNIARNRITTMLRSPLPQLMPFTQRRPMSAARSTLRKPLARVLARGRASQRPGK